MQKYKEHFIRFLIKYEAIKFGTFKTKSGRISPYYINTACFSSGEGLLDLGTFYAEAIMSETLKPTVLFGPSYKGIPIAVSTAIALAQEFGLETHYISDRKEFKDHGDKGSFLGASLHKGSKVLILDDVVTAGTSIARTMNLLKDISGVKVLGAMLAVDRQEKIEKIQIGRLGNVSRPNSTALKLYSIVNIEEVVSYLFNRKINGKIYIDENMKEQIEKYQKQYAVLS